MNNIFYGFGILNLVVGEFKLNHKKPNAKNQMPITIINGGIYAKQPKIH